MIRVYVLFYIYILMKEWFGRNLDIAEISIQNVDSALNHLAAKVGVESMGDPIKSTGAVEIKVSELDNTLDTWRSLVTYVLHNSNKKDGLGINDFARLWWMAEIWEIVSIYCTDNNLSIADFASIEITKIDTEQKKGFLFSCIGPEQNNFWFFQWVSYDRTEYIWGDDQYQDLNTNEARPNNNPLNRDSLPKQNENWEENSAEDIKKVEQENKPMKREVTNPETDKLQRSEKFKKIILWRIGDISIFATQLAVLDKYKDKKPLEKLEMKEAMKQITDDKVEELEWLINSPETILKPVGNRIVIALSDDSTYSFTLAPNWGYKDLKKSTVNID